MRNGLVASLAVFAFCLTAVLANPARAECSADPRWFPHDQTKEADSAGFPAPPQPPCTFHQWSWQMFLWLTQTDAATGEPRFIGFAGPESLDPNLKGKTPATLMPGLELTKPKTLADYLQAGPDGILVDQNGRIVYYSIYINDVFSKFVTDNKLNQVDVLRHFDPTAAFPNGSLELKAAWKIVGDNEDMSGYYTRKALINPLVARGGKFVIDPDKVEQVTVALVGFHIAGTVAYHKEMIWASFENIRNAPDVENLATIRPDTVVSDKDWTFYKANTPFRACNANPAGSGTQKLDPVSQKMTPVTAVCRLYPYGSGHDKQPNAASIRELNASVQARLPDVWKNYFEVGAIWFARAAFTKEIQPNCTFQLGRLQCGIGLTGSTHLSNATIETFTQGQSTSDNCFACHNTVQRFPPRAGLRALPGKNVAISHVVNNLYFRLRQEQH
jgi:hypothetical protein